VWTGFAAAGIGAIAAVGARAIGGIRADTPVSSDAGHHHHVAVSATTSTVTSHEGQRVRCVMEACVWGKRCAMAEQVSDDPIA